MVHARHIAGAALLGAGCTPIGDPGDLRPEALAVVELSRDATSPITLADVLGPAAVTQEPPVTVRVWRRPKDRRGRAIRQGTSCEGQVEELGLETYVAGVLPAEWMASWEPASLEAGAIAARTYASFWSAVGGRYQCADVDDTTWTQVYVDTRHEGASAAVAATEGAVAVLGGSLVFTEYSAENGVTTGYGVKDPHCTRRGVDGHTRGMCQWGSHEWASRDRDAEWIVAHYYPGARVAWPGEELLDGVDLNVRSGERFTLSLRVTNVDEAPWGPGSVGVGTDSDVFALPSWEGPTMPVRLSWEVGQHEVLTLSWDMRAPEVTSATTYAEFFWLDGPAADRPGAEGSWRITVLPALKAPAPEPTEPLVWPWVGLGASCLVLVGWWFTRPGSAGSDPR